jgi:hypothetical protein
VIVQPTLQLAASAKRLRAGQRLRLAGAIAPRKHAVGLIVQRRARGGWRKAGPASTSVHGGRFAVALRPDAGLYRARARFAGDKRNPRATSPTVFFRVLPGRR